MSSALSAAEESGGPGGRDLRAVLSSLPRSLRPAVDGGPTDLREVSGDPGWRDRLVEAAARGARGILVSDPTPEAPGDHVEDSVSIPVVVHSKWTCSETARGAAPIFARLAETGARLDVRIVEGFTRPTETIVLEQLQLARALGRPIDELEILTSSQSSYTALGRSTTGPVSFRMTRTRAEAPSAGARIIALHASAELRVPAPENGRPGSVVVVDDDGERELPLQFEDPRRTSWRRLHSAVVHGNPTDDLRALEADLRTTRSTLETVTARSS
ncbi:hypothetical protein ET445_01725 [Agromyces protaetiae]|uniref:Oxidoreductase n=1 Tax=Agromyces protaetiae TaxID=2509455 RepID=A0A4P6FEU2_9MICO|nr:hypothetical protein [Agromyces protaetiae]QAY72247.1 hypothetical protein ET445_01725 [Agromyces protaetiae]